MCNMRDPCTNVYARAEKDAEPRVEKELNRRDTTTMS